MFSIVGINATRNFPVHLRSLVFIDDQPDVSRIATSVVRAKPPRDRLHEQNQGTFAVESGISLPGTDSQQIIYPSDANRIAEVCYAA